MASVKDLHDSAMEWAQLALMARDQANAYARIACELETKAANAVLYSKDSEPTRSILFRSAATLALQAGDNKLACVLAFQGLDGFPPPDIRAELEEVMRKAKRLEDELSETRSHVGNTK